MRSPSNLLALGLGVALAMKAEAASGVSRIPALEDQAVRTQLSRWIQALNAPIGGNTGYIIVGDNAGEGGGLVPNPNFGELHKMDAAKHLIEVLLDGTRSLTYSIEKGDRDPSETPHLYKGFLLPLILDTPDPIQRYDTTIERYIPPITGTDSFSSCELGRPNWPERMLTDPKNFMYLMCLKDKVFANWVVFADFPKGSTERYYLGGADELPGEFNVDRIEDYWFVMVGFSAPNEEGMGMQGLTLGLSYTEEKGGFGLTTVYGQSQFSGEPSKAGASYTFPYDPGDLRGELRHLSKRMPEPSTDERKASKVLGPAGKVNPSGL